MSQRRRRPKKTSTTRSSSSFSSERSSGSEPNITRILSMPSANYLKPFSNLSSWYPKSYSVGGRRVASMLVIQYYVYCTTHCVDRVRSFKKLACWILYLGSSGWTSREYVPKETRYRWLHGGKRSPSQNLEPTLLDLIFYKPCKCAILKNKVASPGVL